MFCLPFLFFGFLAFFYYLMLVLKENYNFQAYNINSLIISCYSLQLQTTEVQKSMPITLHIGLRSQRNMNGSPACPIIILFQSFLFNTASRQIVNQSSNYIVNFNCIILKNNNLPQ